MTVYSPAQKCHCGSELHPSCGTGDHDTAADLELDALKEQLRRVSFERNAYRHLLEQIAVTPLESFAVDARNILSQFPKGS